MRTKIAKNTAFDEASRLPVAAPVVNADTLQTTQNLLTKYTVTEHTPVTQSGFTARLGMDLLR